MDDVMILPATLRYCEALSRFGLTPVQCLTGVGLKYNAALARIAKQSGAARGEGDRL